MVKTIWFDMDGTLADLYAVDNWLAKLNNFDPSPYRQAAVLHNMCKLVRYLHKVQQAGYTIGIISWTSKTGSELYNGQVALEKMCWLHKHMASVSWDYIKIVPYGTNKYDVCGGGILFDDEEKNRNDWGENAYTPDKIFEVLKALAA